MLTDEKKLISFIKDKDKKVLYHNCGQIMDLVESYTKLGADIIESFSPPPLLGDTDLAKAKELSKGKYIIIGNIDQVNVIKDGSPSIIRQNIKETLKAGKPGGRFILQPSDFLNVGEVTIEAVQNIPAGKEFGSY